MDRKPFIERLKKEVPELKKEGWGQIEIDTLLKHFSFYLGLINGEIKPTSEKQISFIKKVKDYKTAIPKNIHEKVYFKYMKFFFDKNSKKKEIIEDKIWKNIETNTPGTMQYSQEMIDRLNTEYEPISKSDWYDDWKYN